MPTIGFNVESVKYKNFDFTIWDVGGKDRIRPLLRHYFMNTKVIVFIIDSNDKWRLLRDPEDPYGFFSTWGRAEGLLATNVPEDELRDAIWLILCNKQDLPNSMSVEEIVKKMKIT